MGAYSGTMIGLAVACLLSILFWAARKGQPTVGTENGTLMFRYHGLFRGFALVGAFGIPLAIFALGVSFPTREDQLWAILGVVALFAGIGIPLWWEATRYALIVSPEGLNCRSPWRGRLFLPWEEVEEVSYSSMNSWFVIQARGRRKFRVPLFISGIPAFLDQCEQHLDPTSLSRAKTGYTLVGRPFPGR